MPAYEFKLSYKTRFGRIHLFIFTRRQLLGLATASSAMMFSAAGCKPSRQNAAAGFVPIGGIEQWISIRGRDRSRPVILYLHGGPGAAQSLFVSRFASWEERYTVVQWDQRGAGKTFGRHGAATPEMTLDRMALDTVEVAEYLLNRLRLKKLILVGHSWGATLGLNAVQLRPDLFHAFVGTGQPVSWREYFLWMRSFALEKAKAANNTPAIREINALGPFDPQSKEQRGLIERWRALYMAPSDSEFYSAQRRFMNGLEVSARSEVAARIDGQAFSVRKLIPTILSLDAKEKFSEISVPVFLIHGRDDVLSPPEPARMFVERLRAPAKGFTLIEGGHCACFTNPMRFLNALDRNVQLSLRGQ